MGSVRNEAERLVDEAFGVASRLAADVPATDGCGCPVCRVVTAVRDPDPDLTSRVSGVVGDLADGVTGALRTLADLGTPRPDTRRTGRSGGSAPHGPGSPDGGPAAGDSAAGAGGPGADGPADAGTSRTEGSAEAGRATEKGDPGCH